MERLHFSIDIAAPVHRVWSAMLDDATYREWTGVVWEGSYYVGGWDEGDVIRFLGAGSDEDGVDGMLATVVESRVDERVSLEMRGFVSGGVDDTTSEGARSVAGGHEDYTFREVGGITTVEVATDSAEEFADMFRETWPQALARLKEIAER